MQNNHRPIKVVLFDLGYTLIYFSGDFLSTISESYRLLSTYLFKDCQNFDAASFAREFEKQMRQNDAQRQKDLLERPIREILVNVLKQFGQENLPEEKVTAALQAMYRMTEKHWLIEADTHVTLKKLLAMRFALGLISNAASVWDVNNLIEDHQLGQYFTSILISGGEGIRKPNPLLFEKAIRGLGIQPDEAVMVGDTLDADVLGAHKAGMRAVWISRHKNKLPQPVTVTPEMIPDAEISSLSELPVLLERWNSATAVD